MENLNELKNAMDVLMAKLELELSSIKQARIILNANQISFGASKPFIPIGKNHVLNNSAVIKNENHNLKSNANKPIGNETKSKQGRKINQIPQDYPLYGTGTDKLRYILHSKNRAVSEKEFHDEIAKNEGTDSETLKSLDRILRGLSHPENGQWTYFTFSKRGIKFFIHPEWKEKETKTVLFPFRTDVSLIGLNPNECSWNNLIWHRDK